MYCFSDVRFYIPSWVESCSDMLDQGASAEKRSIAYLTTGATISESFRNGIHELGAAP